MRHLNRATEPGVGGDKRKFWRDVMGLDDAENQREKQAKRFFLCFSFKSRYSVPMVINRYTALLCSVSTLLICTHLHTQKTQF
ncbi:MAG TPA: hypothetical protein DDZ80_15950 [Cyanobacteria bacterium UBA8803]|nr:hypothetical protein [Cyanobacteria bacterium UBA9273]HBL59908.1 hypothetical protein [Cyanobacteria bacterium UBA8803]